MPIYANDRERYTAHLVTAVDCLRRGSKVADSAERALCAVERLTALGMDSIDMGAAILSGLEWYDKLDASAK